MRRVLPSTIVSFLREAFSETIAASGSGNIGFRDTGFVYLRVLLRLLDGLDASLWPTDTAGQRFLIAWETVQEHVSRSGQTEPGTSGVHRTGVLHGSQDQPNAVWRRWTPPLVHV